MDFVGADDAYIAGTQTKVIEVVLDHIAWGWDADQIHLQHPHLTLAQVYAALAYYHDHREQFDVQIQKDLREVEALRDAAGDPPKAEQLRALKKRA